VAGIREGQLGWKCGEDKGRTAGVEVCGGYKGMTTTVEGFVVGIREWQVEWRGVAGIREGQLALGVVGEGGGRVG
jgi:hypothetical protein